MFLLKTREYYAVWQRTFFFHDKPGKGGQGLILTFAQQQHANMQIPSPDSCSASRVELYTNKEDSHFMREYKKLRASVCQYGSIPTKNLPALLHHPPASQWRGLKNVRRCQHLLPGLFVLKTLTHLHFPFSLHFKNDIHLQRHARLIHARRNLFLSSSHMVLIIVANKGRVCFHL